MPNEKNHNNSSLFPGSSPEKAVPSNNNSSLKKEIKITEGVDNPDCLGQRLGHNFPVAGAECTKCGVSQNELSGRKPPRGLDRMFQDE